MRPIHGIVVGMLLVAACAKPPEPQVRADYYKNPYAGQLGAPQKLGGDPSADQYNRINQDKVDRSVDNTLLNMYRTYANGVARGN